MVVLSVYLYKLSDLSFFLKNIYNFPFIYEKFISISQKILGCAILEGIRLEATPTKKQACTQILLLAYKPKAWNVYRASLYWIYINH